MDITKSISIKLIPHPMLKKHNEEDIYTQSSLWSGKINTPESTVYGFFEKKQKELEEKGITNVRFLLYDVDHFKLEDVINGSPEYKHMIIRWGMEKI